MFLRELTLTPRDWFLNHDGAIRYAGPPQLGECPADRYPMCPLNRLRHLHHFAANEWSTIALAADHAFERLDTRFHRIRRDLLTACGLTE